jgi:Raf kinase inhibitor-like YbhB/YbcL family protein
VDISPPLAWDGVPEGTASLALIVHDPDAPGPRGFTHWVIFNLPADAGGLPEGIPCCERMENGTIQGRNDGGKTGYMGPSPPPGKVHHYHFTLYALNIPLNLSRGAGRQQALVVMQGHILDEADLVGLYKR